MLETELPGLAKGIKQMAELIGFDDGMATARARINCESIVYDVYKSEFPDGGPKGFLRDCIVFLRKNSIVSKRIIAAKCRK